VRFLLRPGWLAFMLLVIGFAVACYTLLAPWQFRRNAERAEQNQQIAASTTQPPRPLTELVPPGSPPAPSVQWRQAVVHGVYLPGDEGVVRLRTVQGRPAFEVLTAFRTDDGRIVAVDRGYVRPGQDQQAAPFPPAPAGPVTLVGRIRPDESDPQHRASFSAGGHRQLYAADSRLLAEATGLPVAPGYLQLVDGQPGGLGVLPLPDTDSGPFLSYAWQWLSFGAIALFGLVYFIRLELLQRRAEQGASAPQAATPAETSGGSAPATATEATDRPEPAAGGLASVRARRAALREALRGEPPSRPALTEPTRRDEPAPDRERLVERYGKSRF
jgi:cytochrome oxidase assembly protein ShyY1